MRLLYRAPTAPLAGFVDRFWSLSDAPAHAQERILPSGTVELVINLREDEFRIYDPARPGRFRRYSGAIVSGPYSSCFVIDAAQHASIIGVHFKAGGAFPFLGVPAGELADTHVDLEALWGPPARELRERLRAASTSADRFRLLADALAAHCYRPLRHHDAVSTALAAFRRPAATATTREMARRVGLSQRRFIQVFTAAVGMTPKLYSRVRRFQRARALVSATREPSWAQVAVGCGYCDQSHLIHDFLAFSGLTPAGYLRQRRDGVKADHLPIIPG